MNVTVHALDQYDFDAGAADEEGRLRIRRASRLAAAAVAVLVLAGCGHPTGSADAAGAPESRSGGIGEPGIRQDVRWQTSEDFVTAVTQGRCSATFYADFKRKSIVFDAVNPEKKAV
ncbi:hypothetical protein ACFUIT_15170 [Streptomyces sp. NPDC057239]|uniref:hypothetical protein n=1 Tax=Streptomyces sp. NPDC057239 TaxID=3346061 RepID=UPI00362781F9